MGDWDEIRRLANDLQRAQLCHGSQKLSERNCVEIVSKLIEANQLTLIFTIDGKEYITPQHLAREIRDELDVEGNGRLSLVELSTLLRVDYSHIELQARSIVKHDSGKYHLVLGQLITSTYLDSMAEQINERLSLEGTISISNITKEFDLPSDFLLEQLSIRLGSIIDAENDSNNSKVFVTKAYVNRVRARIRGAFSAITIPTSAAAIATRFSFEERLFFTILRELIKSGRIEGELVGGKSFGQSLFIPRIYSLAQNNWVDNFYAQNGYLDFDDVKRQGIADPSALVKKRFFQEKSLVLKSCFLGPSILDQVESQLKEALTSVGCVDIQSLLPSVISRQDAGLLLTHFVASSSSDNFVFDETTVVSLKLMKSLEKMFEEDMQRRIQEDLRSGVLANVFQSRKTKNVSVCPTEDIDRNKEERKKKAASGKAGGGFQGRESKTKSTKVNKKRQRTSSEIEMEASPFALTYLTIMDLSTRLRQVVQLNALTDDTLTEICQYLEPILNRRYLSLANTSFQASLQALDQMTRKSTDDLSEKLNELLGLIRLYAKGCAIFEGNTAVLLERYLLQTLASEFVEHIFNHLFLLYGGEGGTQTTNRPEGRIKLLNNFPVEIAEPLRKINKCLNGNSVVAFLKSLEENLMNACDVTIRRPDKKRDRQIVFAHRRSLQDQLLSCLDPALALHLTSLIVFQINSGAMLHASGKFVPFIIGWIVPHLPIDQGQLLERYQELIVKSATQDLKLEMEQLLADVKAVALNISTNPAE